MPADTLDNPEFGPRSTSAEKRGLTNHWVAITTIPCRLPVVVVVAQTSPPFGEIIDDMPFGTISTGPFVAPVKAIAPEFVTGEVAQFVPEPVTSVIVWAAPALTRKPHKYWALPVTAGTNVTVVALDMFTTASVFAIVGLRQASAALTWKTGAVFIVPTCP
jgi:hypothetical protein